MRLTILVTVLAAVCATTSVQGNLISNFQALFGQFRSAGELMNLARNFLNVQGDAGRGFNLEERIAEIARLLGRDTTDLLGIFDDLTKAQEKRELLDESRTRCAAITKDWKKSVANSKCNYTTIQGLVFEELHGKEQTLNYVIDSGDYPGFREAVFLCHARETVEHYSWADIGAYLSTHEGRRQRGRATCSRLINNKEKGMCTDVKKAICSMVDKGEHLECRRTTEMRKWNHRAYLQMTTFPVEKPLRSLNQVPFADFTESIPHNTECDHISLILKNKALRGE